MTRSGRVARRLLIASLVIIGRPSASRAQQVLETDKLRIEVIGLRRWSIPMIQDSLARYAPQSTLTAHACAAILRDKLHFADASVSYYQPVRPSDKEYVAITIVEPQDSARIHYKPLLHDTLPGHAEWDAAYAAFEKNSQLGQRALQAPGFFERKLSVSDSANYAALAPIHALIEHPRVQDFTDAIHTLDHDANIAHRTMAIVVLSAFTYNDTAWYAIADALRDQAGIVTGTASQVLTTMARSRAKVVDWRPMTRQLRYLLDGTNLFATNAILETLTKTNVSYELAPALLADGGAIVLAKLRSGDDWSRRKAAEFLAQLSGKPVVTCPEDWTRWTATLRASDQE